MMEMWIVCDGWGGIYAICDFEHQARKAKEKFKSISLLGLKIKKIFIEDAKCSK